MDRTLAIVIVSVLAVAAVAVGGYILAEPPQGGGSPGDVTGSPVGAPSGGSGGPGGAPMGHGVMTCGTNGAPPGQLINWLLDNHDIFTYRVERFPSNRSIVWVVAGPDRGSVETLASHIRQMECLLEQGMTPRAWDPLFQAEAQVSDRIHTRIDWVNETAIRIVKVAMDDCAYRVMDLHSRVVEGFFNSGRVEASQSHPLPADVEACLYGGG